MSFRDKAREVKEAGVAKRGDFVPPGVPKRIYQWWLHESNSKRAHRVLSGKERENFCHFVRVVVFWAPLRWAVYKAEQTAAYWGTAVIVALLGAFVYLLFTADSVQMVTLFVVLGFAALLIAAGGLASGGTLAMSPEDRDKSRLGVSPLLYVLAVIGLPFTILGFVLAKIMDFYTAHLSDYTSKILGGVAALAVLGYLIGLGLSEGWVVLGLVLAGAVAAVVFVGAIIVGLSVLSDYIAGKRSLAEVARIQAREDYYEEHGEFPPGAKPRTSGFFSGLGDFIVFLAQVIRVGKWKFCPLVEIDDDERVAA